MNERIRELAEQAEQYALDKANDGDDESYEYSFDDNFREKFAELIVKQCTSFISDSLEAANVNLSSRPNDDYWLGFRHACDDHLTDIRQHFGVK